MTSQNRRPRVLVTGGAGFLGTLLIERLLGDDTVRFDGFQLPGIASVAVVDIREPLPHISADPRVTVIVGALEDAARELDDIDIVFHLAGVVSGAAEADFDLGMRTNLDGTRHLLDWARTIPSTPTLVFASSLAVFGSDPAIGPIGEVDDGTMPRPQSSYGIQKFIGEQLVADYTRKGYISGRTVRLMSVSVRPGAPNAAASSFMSGIIREPIDGVTAPCPVPPDMPIALSSPHRTIEGILRAAAVDGGTWGSRTAMNLPALTTTPREMAEALDRIVPGEPSKLIEWTEDPAVIDIVGSWPSTFRTDRATALGLTADASFDQIITQYVGARTALAS